MGKAGDIRRDAHEQRQAEDEEEHRLVINKGWHSLQQGYERRRKRGWYSCEYCGMGGSFNDRSIAKEHYEGKTCSATKKDRIYVDKLRKKGLWPKWDK